MESLIMYWALIVAFSDGRVEEVYRTYEPCQIRAQNYKQAGIIAECIPTTSPDIMRSEQQLRSLATLLYDRTDRSSR